MQIVNTDTIPGKNIEVMSLVTGACIMSKNIGHDIGSSFRNIIGGKMESYTEMLNEAKNEAIRVMMQEAAQMGADAIVAVRFSSSTIVQGGAEMLAYGTAVRFI